MTVHGGYFYGEYSRKLIYRIAFLGFERVLEAIAAEALECPPGQVPESKLENKQHMLQAFYLACREKGL